MSTNKSLGYRKRKVNPHSSKNPSPNAHWPKKNVEKQEICDPFGPASHSSTLMSTTKSLAQEVKGLTPDFHEKHQHND